MGLSRPVMGMLYLYLMMHDVQICPMLGVHLNSHGELLNTKLLKMNEYK
jgi:hypothetical protein